MQSLHQASRGAYARFIAFNALVFFALLPGARAIFKYTPDFQWIVFLAEFMLVSALLNSSKAWIKGVIGNRYLLALIGIGMVVAVYYMYPIADGLKVHRLGSDQDDCIMLGVARLLAGQNPYLDRTYFGNMCFTGFGVFAYYLPFVFLKVYFLGGLVALGSYFGYVFHGTRRYEDLGVLTILVFSCIAVPELLSTGSDLVFVGSGIALLSVMGMRVSTSKNWRVLLLMAVLAGLLSSARMNFLVIFPLVSIFLFLRWRAGAAVLFILAGMVAILPSLFIYLSSPADFTPLVLIGKGQSILPRVVILIALLLSITGVVTGLVMLRNDVARFPEAMFLSLMPGLLILSFGDLYGRSGSLALWEGANYLIPLVPLAAFLVLQLRQASLGEADRRK